jgi:tyrosyl-tRNA synthetase
MVAEFHSEEAAAAARAEFDRVFSRGKLPQDIPDLELTVSGDEILLSKVLVEGGLAGSNSEARRLIQQGGVKVDGETATDIKALVSTVGSEPILLQVGKRRFAKVSFHSG